LDKPAQFAQKKTMRISQITADKALLTEYRALMTNYTALLKKTCAIWSEDDHAHPAVNGEVQIVIHPTSLAAAAAAPTDTSLFEHHHV